MADPEMRKRLAALEADLTVSTPEAFGILLKSELLLLIIGTPIDTPVEHPATHQKPRSLTGAATVSR